MGAHLFFLGGEDHHLRLAFMLALKARGYRITAAGSGRADRFHEAGLEYLPIEFDRFISPHRDFGAVRRLSALLRKVNADLVHCYDTKLTVLVALAARANVRSLIVRTINGRGWIYSSSSPVAFALRCIYPSLQRVAAKSAAATVFEHRGDYSYFEDHHLTGKSDVTIIPGAGIDVQGFERALAKGPTPAELRRELRLGEAPVVITVTRVTREKGIPGLLRAAELVHAKRPDVKFLVVGPRKGEGPSAMSDDEMSRHSDYVIETGARDDVPSLLAMANVFAFPSEYAEGIPRALMEAALCGLPVVATAIDGCREVIRDGWNGVIAPLRSPHAFADGILTLLENRDRALTMAARGPALIRKDFSLDAIVAGHVELYERLLARGHRGTIAGADFPKVAEPSQRAAAPPLSL